MKSDVDEAEEGVTVGIADGGDPPRVTTAPRIARTLLHPLVRVLLAEQLYRGWTLLAGHPYHR